MQQTFGKFPQCRIITENVIRVGDKYKPYRWEIIKRECADFDIFLDDYYKILKELID